MPWCCCRGCVGTCACVWGGVDLHVGVCAGVAFVVAANCERGEGCGSWDLGESCGGWGGHPARLHHRVWGVCQDCVRYGLVGMPIYMCARLKLELCRGTCHARLCHKSLS